MTASLKKKNIKWTGLSINPGRVFGKVCLYSAERHKAVPEYSLSTDEAVTQDLQRFEEVIEQCSTELNGIASMVSESIGKTESEIFLTQKHIMNDPKVLEAIRKGVTGDRKNLEWAISDALSSFEERFATLDNQYLRERSSDIGEIRRRLLSTINHKKSGFLCRGQQHCSRGENRIIVSEELTPDMIVNMDVERVLGFVTEHGGLNSHAAIMARSLGIPALSGVTGIMEIVECGDLALIDADNGDLYLNPDENVVEELVPIEEVEKDALCVLGSPPGIEVLSNASTLEDVRQAQVMGADGIGLFRTEIFFIKYDRLITFEEQFDYYAKIFKIMAGKPVVFRLLDAGGDKPLPFLRLKKEANPFLGWRGARFLLGNPAIFETQVRAIAKVSLLGQVKILYPMVVDAAQLRELLARTEHIFQEMECVRTNIELGTMFEIPSAFLQAREILSQCDFGSIGSNDLIQYLFAIDRGNERVSQDYNPDHPVLWDLLRSLSDSAQALGKPLSICGEMAGREGMPRRLMEIGIHALSVSPRLIPRVRNEMARSANMQPL